MDTKKYKQKLIWLLFFFRAKITNGQYQKNGNKYIFFSRIKKKPYLIIILVQSHERNEYIFLGKTKVENSTFELTNNPKKKAKQQQQELH